MLNNFKEHSVRTYLLNFCFFVKSVRRLSRRSFTEEERQQVEDFTTTALEITKECKAVAKMRHYNQTRFDNQFSEGVPTYKMLEKKVSEVESALLAFVSNASEDAEVDVMEGYYWYGSMDESNQRTCFELYERQLRWYLSKLIPGQRSEVWSCLSRTQYVHRNRSLRFFSGMEKSQSRSFLFAVKLPKKYVYRC